MTHRTRYLPPVLLALLLGGLAATGPAAGGDPVPSRLIQISRQPIDSVTDLAALGLGSANKPNGRIYRLRETPDGTHPIQVPRLRGGLELGIADPIASGFAVLYRAPVMSGPQSRESLVVLFDAEGRQTRELDLTPLLSGPDHLEVQDFRYHAGRIYFNEACQSYSQEAGGRCSALVCADLDTGRVLWRTAPLVSNNIFIIYRNRVFCGYGFTAEPDFLFILDADTGRMLSRTPIDSAHDYMEIQDGHLLVTTYRSLYRFRIDPAVFGDPAVP